MSCLAAGQNNPSEDLWSGHGHQPFYKQNPSYDSRRDQNPTFWFAGGLPSPPVTKAMAGVQVEPAYPQAHTYQGSHPQQRADGYEYAAQATNLTNNTAYSQMDSQSSQDMSQGEKRRENTIASYLQIPESVNQSKGSLAEFAAEISCLFWFETAETLQYAENLPINASAERGMHPDATPSIGFRKWVTTILSTTQVGKNVILLALMFIYRLKKFNPSVSGKRGSEFRLLTIALMLGNKFLDDNTYTNKTWAEVSGISVQEIHIMEVEFLSNMRYELYVSEQEWQAWKATLGRLSSFYEKAQMVPYSSRPSPITPVTQSFPQKLPSPPSTHHSSNGYMSAGPSPVAYHGLPNPLANAPQLPRSPLRHQRIGSIDPLEHRKRSLDTSNDMPPAKRMNPGSISSNSTGSLLTPTSYTSNYVGQLPHNKTADFAFPSEAPRLPMPRMPASASNLSSNQLAPLNMPVNRAMSSVYPVASSAGWSQPITPVSAGPSSLYQTAIPSLGDASRPPSHLSSRHTSPTGYNSMTPVMPGTSPSYFLTHRTSPYRPVRHVNTLLYPPPSAALQPQTRPVSYEQMHYQPLSKAGVDRRPGPVPYMQSDWQQSNANTPLSQKYPYRI